MESARPTTVLFARLVGDADHEMMAGCLARLRQAAEACGGRVIEASGDKMMVLMSVPEVAADIAVAMHTAMDEFPAAKGKKLAAGIGFHHGPVNQKGEEVFGDTVNLASRLVERAAGGQIITTEETGALLSRLYKAWMRHLYSIQLQGRTQEIGICELVWRADNSATLFAPKRARERPALTVLKLKYRDQKVKLRRGNESMTIGRGEECSLVVADTEASRLHCTIERRQGKFVLVDQSTNGTYVTVEGADEMLVQREEFMLSKQGWITLGRSRAATTEVVEFSFEE
jgi:adenylate cyclase